MTPRENSNGKRKQKRSEARTSKAKDYIVGMRADKDLYERLEAVASGSRRKIAAVLALCVEDRLPEIEAELGIKPGQKPTKRTII